MAVESYREQGYLPEAFLNYLGLLGWSPPGGEEIFEVDRMVEWFRLEDVNHSPAFFDLAKLTHINGEYIRALSPAAFLEACRPWLTGEGATWPAADFDEAVFSRLAPLVQERVSVLSEVPSMVDFMFLESPAVDEEAWAKAVAGDELAGEILARAIESYRQLSGDWNHDSLHAATRAVGDAVGRKLNKAQAPIRVAITGRRVGPPLFEVLEVMGPDRSIARLQDALARSRPRPGT